MMKLAIIGLGYVGLPLALELSKNFKTVGFDKNLSKVKLLNNGYNYVESKNFKKNKNILFSNNIKDLKQCNVFIICVPTPVSKNNKPDLTLLESAFKIIKNVIKKKDLIISESTVYPGITRKLSKKILENKNFIFNKDFYVGYSPERINPGDKVHNIKNIYKIISCENVSALLKMKKIYSSVTNKLYITKNIEVAEASKVIENAQRDINIAFINEISKIMIKNKIPVYEVLKAAKTKWNFLNFKPGLVGGHCIGVDPYYLNDYAIKSKINSRVILSGRKTNNSMPYFFYNLFLKNLKKTIKKKYNVLFMGVTFKENVNDFRNSKAIEIINLLKKNKKINLSIYDPLVNKKDIMNSYKLHVDKMIKIKKYDAILFGTKHSEFKKLNENKMNKLLVNNGLVFDIFNFLKFNNNKIHFKYLTI